MFLTDFHMHSTCSFDANDTMADMLTAARDRGIEALCFTDHCDFDIPETMQLDGFAVPAQQRAQYDAALQRAPAGMYVGLGLELGEANHAPDRALGVYAMPEYDFILGSLHNLRDTADFYDLRYESYEQCYALYDLYLDELIELAALPCFDVMAHIGYCIRYMHGQGFHAELSMERQGDRIDKLLRILIENGRGVELNCADLVAGGRENPLLCTIPTVPIMRRYRELGGEIVTLGSDAHNTRCAGFGIREGCELLRDIGFRYTAMYRRHKPIFIKI